MKKIILMTLLIIIIPINLKAVSIGESLLSGPNETKIGEEYTIYLQTGVNEVDPGFNNTVGYGIVLVEINFNTNDFILEEIKSPYFKIDYNNSYYIDNEKGHQLLTFVFTEEKSNNSCGYNLLYCGLFRADFKFYTKNTTSSTTTVKVGQVAIGALDFKDTKEETLTKMTEDEASKYLEENMTTHIKEANQSKTINIIKTNTPIEKEPIKELTPNSSTSKDNIKNVIKQTTPSTNTSAKKKSSNSYLSSLEIQNYSIEFDKNTKEYEIYTSPDINRINVKATPEYENAYVKITGNDDLKTNDYKVTIEVRAEDKTTSIYTINVRHKEVTEEESKEEEKPKVHATLDKKIIKIMAYTGGSILLIILLIIISNIRKKRALNKLYNEL